MQARATQELTRFNLDLRKPMKVAAVLVDGKAAAFKQRRAELVVSPAAPLAQGSDFVARVRYRGSPEPLVFPPAGEVGWIKQRRAAFVANEPHAASTWYPVNDHPLDKATYAVRARVPKDLTAVSNGEFGGSTRRGPERVFRWSSPEPIASYLVTLTIGRFQAAQSTIAGVPAYIAWKRSIDFDRKRFERKYGQITRFLSRKLGPYPFTSTGAILFGDLGDGSYLLETQTRPLFQEDPLRGGDEAVVVHELAHQWFGNSVTHSAWDELWLNEGFSTWTEWLWEAEAEGGRSLEELFDENYDLLPTRKDVAIAAIENREQLATGTIYVRGALTLEALRQRVGDPTFDAILKAWVAENRYGNVTTEDFIALAERESGLDLTRFFDIWVFRPDRPENW